MQATVDLVFNMTFLPEPECETAHDDDTVEQPAEEVGAPKPPRASGGYIFDRIVTKHVYGRAR
jgi:hypothetical protein